MSRLYRRPEKPGGTYYLRYTGPDGLAKDECLHTKNKSEAMFKQQQKDEELAAGQLEPKQEQQRRKKRGRGREHAEFDPQSQEEQTHAIAVGKNFLRNLLLVAGSIVAVFLLTVMADWIVGRFSVAALPPGNKELIFPPNSEHSFETCEFKYTAHINSLGLRDREIGPGKTGTFRIAVIGDSYTYGWGVEIEQAWIKQLEQNLQKTGYDVEVINVGAPGTGPPFFAMIAERAVPILQPDLIVVSLLEGDDLVQSTREGLEGFSAANQMLLDAVKFVYPNLVRQVRIARQVRQIAPNVRPVTPPQKTTAEDNRRWDEQKAIEFHEKMTPEQRVRFDALEDVVKTAFLTGRLDPNILNNVMQDPESIQFKLRVQEPRTPLIQNMSEQLARIKRVAEDYKAKLVCVAIPLGPYVNRPAFDSITHVGWQALGVDVLKTGVLEKELQMACDRVSIKMVDGIEGFRRHIDESGLFFELDGHFTPKGHKLFAELVTPAFMGEMGDKAKKK